MTTRILIAIAIACSGCGHDAAKDITKKQEADLHEKLAADPGGKKPCAYMARADAEAALGIPLPGTTEELVTNNCVYNSKEFYGADLYVGTWESITQSWNGNPTARVPVTGIGDEAVSVGGRLYVRKGDRALALSLNGPAVDASSDVLLVREKALALKILPNL
jgi:hypothetical protein